MCFVLFLCQTSTIVLITHVLMVHRVWMVSTITRVTAWRGLLEITVRSVSSFLLTLGR